MSFPRNQGFETSHDEQFGDVFARATILEVLATAQAHGIHDFRSAIEQECAHLVAMRRRHPPGGWAYFPELYELPPDLDDLAQVLRGFLRAGRMDLVEAYGDEPIEHMLEAWRRSARIDTWAIPATRLPVHERQALWVERAWGQSVDVEVIANMVHLLALVDSDRYAPFLADATTKIAAFQNGGLFTATWYHGPFYPTFVCARALRARGDFGRHEASCAAVAGLQRRDGGWGYGEESDALSTAFAMLSLHSDQYADARARGADFLLRKQQDGGYWSNIPWIKMELPRTGGGAVQTVLSYGSASVVTAYALLALLSMLEGV